MDDGAGAIIGQVQLADLVFAEGRDAVSRIDELGRGPRPGTQLRQPPHSSATEVGEEIDAAQRGGLASPVNVAAGHGAVPGGVGVLGDREDLSGGVATGGRVEAQTSFHHPPAVIASAGIRRRLIVDLFPASLADVADVQVAARPVERKTPWITQPVGPDFPSDGRVRVGDERVIRRNRVGHRRVNVQAEDFAQQDGPVLRVVGGVAGAPAVSNGKVEESVWAELDHAAVVIGGGLGDRQQDLPAGGVGDRRVGRYGVARQHHRTAVVGVGDEEPSIRLVGRVKSETEQTLLAAAVPHDRGDVEEGRRQECARSVDDANPPGPLENEQPAGPVAGVRDEQGLGESADDRLEGQVGDQVQRVGRRR